MNFNAVNKLLQEQNTIVEKEMDVVKVGDKSWKFPSQELAELFQKYLKKYNKQESVLTFGTGKDIAKESLIFRLGTDNKKRVDFKDLALALFIYDKMPKVVYYRDKLSKETGDRELIVKTHLERK